MTLTPIPTASHLDPDPAQFDVVVFVSGAAAGIFLDRRAERGLDRWPDHVAAATVGPASAAALREHAAFGPRPRVFCPAAGAPTFDSEALHAELTTRQTKRNRVLIVRGETGRDWLAKRLAEEGADVHIHAAYRREPAAWPDGIWQQLFQWCQAGDTAAWLYTSAEGIEAVGARLRGGPLAAWWSGCDAIVTHPRLVHALGQARTVAELPASGAGGSRAPLHALPLSSGVGKDASTCRGPGRILVAPPEEAGLFDAFVAL